MRSFWTMLDDLRMAVRFAAGLSGYLARPLTEPECRARLERQLHARVETFLALVERGIFGNPRSPYRPLLERARIECGDVARLVRGHGLEGALERLYEAGVHVTLDEFKGRRAIDSGADRRVHATDFENPLLARHFEVRTGGSRGARRRAIVDLHLLTHEACYEPFVLRGLGAGGRPWALWRPVPPGSAGIKTALRYAKLGHPPVRWFTQQPVSLRSGDGLKSALLTCFTVRASRWLRVPLPMPEHAPLDQAVRVARWAADSARAGAPVLINTNAACAVRVCLAAREHGLDIAGTLFRVGGEPYSPGKARVIAEAGCRAFSHYSMAEVGRIGVACTAPAALDDVHVTIDKMAVIQRPVGPAVNGALGGLFLTTLHPRTPMIMLNVESGDCATLVERACGCPLDALGFRQHLHTIRSYEKLTSEGMHVVGSDLLQIVEEILPARFGGHATDYQFVEDEENGLPKVSVVVSARVGPLDDAQVVAAVLQALALGSQRSSRMMVERWHQARTLRVVRGEPYATGASKVLSLHARDRKA